MNKPPFFAGQSPLAKIDMPKKPRRARREVRERIAEFFDMFFDSDQRKMFELRKAKGHARAHEKGSFEEYARAKLVREIKLLEQGIKDDQAVLRELQYRLYLAESKQEALTSE